MKNIEDAIEAFDNWLSDDFSDLVTGKHEAVKNSDNERALAFQKETIQTALRAFAALVEMEMTKVVDRPIRPRTRAEQIAADFINQTERKEDD